MAFDGITIRALKEELNQKIEDGYIAKIIQPEPDALILTIKKDRGNIRLLLSANASLPLIYLTDKNVQAPMTAPNFCMLLRKHIGGGHIISVEQPSLERILVFSIEHRNELGDLCIRKLIIEAMGKHSNIIFCDDQDRIIDSIKHISGNMSSVREVLPGRPYFIPNTMDKYDPLTIKEAEFTSLILSKPAPLYKALYTSLTGISPVIAQELCFRAEIDGDKPANTLSSKERSDIYKAFCKMTDAITNSRFSPSILYKGKIPEDFAVLDMSSWGDFTKKYFASISELLESYYAEKDSISRIRQKSADLRKVITTHMERTSKKLILQEKQMKDTDKMDQYRLYGELLQAYGYGIDAGLSSIEVDNYYSGEKQKIPLDRELTPIENSKKFFDRYSKLKRTREALQTQLEESRSSLQHLESISTSLDLAQTENDLSQIRDELSEFGYMKKKTFDKRQKKVTSSPLHFISCDGYDIYVGKNNYQNEEVSFKLGSGNDWWFHAKNMPGSHVIVKNGGNALSDEGFEEAGRLAAFYSGGRLAPKVEIDYTLKKNLKKPAGAKPGFVVYYTNYSLMAKPDIQNIKTGK